MNLSTPSFIASFNFAQQRANPTQLPILAAVLLTLIAFFMPTMAFAAGGFNVPFIQDIGCDVVSWLRGPLAIVVFVIVVAATLVVGMITKMDWGRIITVCIIFGVLLGLGSLLANSGYINNVAGMSACLQ